jgi:hypothetical protein
MALWNNTTSSKMYNIAKSKMAAHFTPGGYASGCLLDSTLITSRINDLLCLKDNYVLLEARSF